MKILITGANGFIGSAIVEEAVARGYEVWAGVRKSSDLTFLKDLDIHYIDLNYAHPHLLIQQFVEQKEKHGGWDIIVHNAGVTKCDNKADFEKINYSFTRNFVNALMEAEIVPKQFIFMSSLSACGTGDEETNEPMRLTDLPQPNTLYGLSKLKAEHYIKNLNKFPYVFLRPTGVYGPREKDYLMMIKTIKRGFDPAIGSRPQYLTFIYVSDLVRVIFAIIDKNITRKAYFVSDGKTYTNTEYSDIVKKALGKKWVMKLPVPLWLVKVISWKLDIIYALFGKSPTLNRDKYRIISAHNWRCDTTALQTDLDFMPEVYLEEGVRRSIEWYRENKWL
jgi:nucleoside-diphosphate-sugar epimerase